jgi:hypothetical protein
MREAERQNTGWPSFSNTRAKAIFRATFRGLETRKRPLEKELRYFERTGAKTAQSPKKRQIGPIGKWPDAQFLPKANARILRRAAIPSPEGATVSSQG